MKKNVKEYINVMIDIFNKKYEVNKFIARLWIWLFGFKRIMKQCNYFILHDDAEDWVDAIYEWVRRSKL